MKGSKFSNAKKGIAIALEHIFITIFIIGIYMCLAYLSATNGEIETTHYDYFQSKSYAEIVKSEAFSLINHYIPLREMFESDISNVIVDIKSYAETGNIDNKAGYGLNYTLEDLINWQEAGIQYKDIYMEKTLRGSGNPKLIVVDELTDSNHSNHNYGIISEDSYIEGEVTVEEATEYLENGTVMSSSATDNPEDMTTVTQYYIEAAVEEYKPIDYKDIIEYLNKNSDADIQDTYYYLSLAIEHIGLEKDEYNQYANRFAAGNSNMRYVVRNLLTGKLWTNSNLTSSELLEMETYLEFNTLDYSIHSNLNQSRVDLNQFALNNYVIGNYQVTVAIDRSLKVKDVVYLNKEAYEKWQPLGLVGLVLLIASFLGVLITVIYLTIAAGRRGEDNEIYLSWFDGIKTEVFVIMVLMSLAFCVLFITQLSYDLSSLYGIPIFVILAVILNETGLITYLSFVRRIKSNTFISNSMIAGIFRCFKAGISLGKMTTLVIIKFAGYIIINILLHSYIFIFFFNVYVLYLLLNSCIGRTKILAGTKKISSGSIEFKIDTRDLKGEYLILAEEINNIGEGLHHAVEKSVKDERLKTDLITNVSHDIKTPLTSIINYVDLLKRENIEDERINGYIKVLDNKSQRLKTLTEDLVEASKISSGNIVLEFVNINFNELVLQTNGEFDNKFKEKNLEVIANFPEHPIIISGDGRRIWRILENLYNNICKYAMENTRVYIDLIVSNYDMLFIIKNISKYPLNIDSSKLTERFIRGDVSRNTEGSGLGLSIAKNLTELQKGQFEIYLDGDLFKVTIKFPIVKERNSRESEELFSVPPGDKMEQLKNKISDKRKAQKLFRVNKS